MSRKRTLVSSMKQLSSVSSTRSLWAPSSCFLTGSMTTRNHVFSHHQHQQHPVSQQQRDYSLLQQNHCRVRLYQERQRNVTGLKDRNSKSYSFSTASATEEEILDGSYSGSGYADIITEYGEYPNNVTLPYTSNLALVKPETQERWPVYRVMESSGLIRPTAVDPNLDEEMVVKMYKTMLRLQTLDLIFYNAQRQGRISFYMTNSGEEAIHIGSSAAIDKDDTIFAQYREAGVLMWRGFTLSQFADQCFSNEGDLGKGRQMPVHYGTNELNFQTISSPLATQLPQAAGAAYAMKMEALQNPDKKKKAVICYVGEGAASEGDAHAAMNMSATLEVPVVFFVRNNGYAISTGVVDQYRGDGIISRAPGYGMAAIRCDGNDIWAVYNATKAAREMAVRESRPVMVEAMTYRIGHHSTSDDSTRYRGVDEIKSWQTETHDPVIRLRKYMERKGWWSKDEEVNYRDEQRFKVLQALETAERKNKPSLSELFTDVYAEKPHHLQKQEKELLEHIEKYPDYYKSGGH